MSIERRGVAADVTRGRHARPEVPIATGSARSRLLGGLVVVVAAAVLGAASSGHPLIVFGIVLVVAGLALLNARPIVWIVLAVTVPWTSRLLTTTGLAPRFFDFLDFPLVIAAFVCAGNAYLAGQHRLVPGHRRIARCVLVLALVMTLSWALNDAGEPQRLLASLVLTLEPFLLLLAVLMAPLRLRERRALVALMIGLVTAQLLFSLVAIAGGERQDAVKGTLLETGAGHHVSAGGLVLGFFLLVGLRVRKPVLIAFGVGTLVVLVLADGKQLLFLLPLALAVLGFTQRRTTSTASAVSGIVAAVVMAGAAATALLTYQSTEYAFTFIDRTFTNKTGKIAVATALWDDLDAAPPTLAFGLGPGETVSRFSFLTTPALLRDGSPVALLGLHASRGADRYSDAAAAGPFTGDSSFTGPQSSVLGVLGDYGLVGASAFLALILAIIGALRRSGNRGLRSAALASWILLLPLAVVFDWLEQPPFTLLVAVITALALRNDPAPDGRYDAGKASGRTTGQDGGPVQPRAMDRALVPAARRT